MVFSEILKASNQFKDRQLNVVIHEIGLVTAKLFNRRVKEVGLTRAQWYVLYLLNEEDGLKQTELADRLSMTKPTLGNIVDLLEADDWVIRKPDRKDRRAKRVFLTSKIEPLIQPLEEIMDEIRAITTRGLTAEQQRIFSECLVIAYENLTSFADET